MPNIHFISSVGRVDETNVGKLNSGVISFFVEADIFFSVCNFDQSVASSPLTPDAAVT